MIDAVDLNAAHIALNKLKLAAVRHLPSQADLFRFFGEAGNDTNSAAYDRFLAPNLDAATRRYWEKRGWRGRRRIATFDRNFYRTGLLGLFIAPGHKTARLYGVDPSGILKAQIWLRSAASSRRSWPDLRPQADAAGAVEKIVAVRPRHSAGAVRFADRLRRRLDGKRAARRGWKSSPAIFR